MNLKEIENADIWRFILAVVTVVMPGFVATACVYGSDIFESWQPTLGISFKASPEIIYAYHSDTVEIPLLGAVQIGFPDGYWTK